MPAYNLKEKFAPLVETGRKRSTIRPRRKRPTKPGDRLFLYTGMRTKRCRRLCKAVCRKVQPIDIFDDTIVLNGQELDDRQQMKLARAYGFDTVADFHHFFEKHYGLPLVDKMELIRW